MRKIPGGVTAAKGYRAACCAAGIKYKDRTDMAMVLSDVPCAAAGVFTSNKVKAAPVLWDRELVQASSPVQAVVVNAGTGEILASSVKNYPRWSRGLYCDPQANQWRQHPKDYLEVLEFTVKDALSKCAPEVAPNVVGIAFDTTGSTPAFADESGTPLAMSEEYAADPDAMFVLWKDHTAIKEAEEINAACKASDVDYSMFEGGIYSSEWFWAKALHILRNSPEIATKASTIVECCEWLPAVLTGVTNHRDIVRSRCAAHVAKQVVLVRLNRRRPVGRCERHDRH